VKRLASACGLMAVISTVIVAGGGPVVDVSTAGLLPQARTARVHGADWQRFNYDAQRSGVGPADTGITTRNLRSLRARVVLLDGTVDSAAIELQAVRIRGRIRDVIVVTTTYGETIALAAGTGARLWEFTPPDIRAYEGSAQVTTTTPIADPDRRYVYAASPDGLIHKLAIATGHEIHAGRWPVRVTSDATLEKIASALNISGNSVIAVTGGYIGDAPPYQGHLVMIDRASGRITAVWNSLCSNRHRLIAPPSSCGSSDSAIWGRAGAVVEPVSGRILIATGNGPFNGSTDWGDSALELSRDGRRLLQSWTPTDQANLEATDTDVGSTAPALLPEVGGHRLIVQGGKAGVLDLLNLNRLNGTPRPGPRLGGALAQIQSPGGGEVFTAPVVWRHRGRTYLFVADGAGTWAYVVSGGPRPRLHVAWQDGIPGTSPVLAGGLLYVYDPGGTLDILEPTSGQELISLPVASGHWNSPIAVGGRIVVPVGNYMAHATSGSIYIYHLPGR
jgi:outer membrane protein assembly factor BamB